MLMGESLSGDTTAGQNATEGIRPESYSEVVIEEVRRRARVLGFDNQDSRQSTKHGGRRCGLFSRGKNRGYQREGGKKFGSGQGRFYFSTSGG